MIELKPYRGTEISRSKKDEEAPLEGHIKTGSVAYSSGRLVTKELVAYAFTDFVLFFCAWQDIKVLMCFGLIGVCYIVVGIREHVSQKRLERHIKQPQLLVSTNNPHRGEQFHVVFRQSFLKDAVIERSKIEIFSREEIGSDTPKYSKPTVEEKVIGALESSDTHFIHEGDTYEQALTVTIPVDARRSFTVQNHNHVWLIRVMLDVKPFGILTETYGFYITRQGQTL